MKITVVVAGPEGLREAEMVLTEGATIADALRVALIEAEAVGVWGRVRAQTHVLRDGDRVEIYAPLKADPKEARRAKLPKKTQWRKN
jgi:uncharacterized protein